MLTPLLTREVRWFGRGEIPAGLQAWFEGLGENQTQPRRTDLYLAGLDASVGIKLREGLLEIKPRLADHGGVSFLPGASGRVGDWMKWGFAISPQDWPGLNSAHWVPVSKIRQMLYYRCSDSGEVSRSAPEDVPARGGGLELTGIILASGERWWTLGLEVIGWQGARSDILRQIVLHVFDQNGSHGLEIEKSYSYPEWLQGITELHQ